MKKASLLLLVATFFIYHSSFAQFRTRPRFRQRVQRSYQEPNYKPALSFSLGYGYPNLDKNSLLDFYQYYHGSVSQKGPVFGSLDYRFNRTTSVGAMVSYGKVDAPYYGYNATAGAPSAFSGHLENWSVLLNFVRYLPGSASVSPYMRTSFGVNVWNQNYLDGTGTKVFTALPDLPVFAYQARLGVKFHFSQHAGAFLEAGYGKYIVSAGLSFKLNK